MSISKVLNKIMAKEPNMFARYHLHDVARIADGYLPSEPSSSDSETVD